MIRTMYVIYPAYDTVHMPFVLRRMGEEKLVVMQQYQDLVCPKCGKVSEQAALARGISPEVVIKSKRPILISADSFNLVNERAKDIFSTLVPGEIDYYRIHSCGFYVASAKVWREPKEADSGFRFIGGRCPVCARPRGIIWDNKVPVRLAEFKPFLCINLETRIGAMALWLVAEQLADQLKKVSPRLSGIHLDPMQVDDGSA
jgi:hypothetical protein